MIEGPKLCGKTTTAEQAAKSVLYLSDPDAREQNLHLAEVQPRALLSGKAPRLLDEWQLAPTLWDAVRFEVDHRGEPGQFILTGSAVPADKGNLFHSGTGRFSWLKMRPMSLFESGDSSGAVSLSELFSQKETAGAESEVDDIERLTHLICRGGWPTTLTLNGKVALDRAYDYYDAIVKEDISRVDGIKRSEERTKRLLRSYARFQGSQTTLEEIRRDMLSNDTDRLDTDTVASYVNALKEIFVIEDMPSWNPNLRSKTAIRTSDTRYFVDASIAGAALGIGPKDLINDLNTCGLLFETMCVRDLRVYADVLDGNVYHYRDKLGLECDAVVHLRDGRYGLIEIKLGGKSEIEHGAATLQKLAGKLDYDRMKEPSFLMVLVGKGKYAYQREDGVFVVPVGSLGP